MNIAIKNVLIYDGLGDEPFLSSICIADGKIAGITSGDTGEVHTVIDGSGLGVCPGFIDTHSHSDLEVFRKEKLSYAISQGITTEIIGQDGLSLYPAEGGMASCLHQEMELYAGTAGDNQVYPDYQKFTRAVKNSGYVCKVESLVGHGTLRLSAAGMEKRALTDTEINHMQSSLNKSMEEGAKGLSFSFESAPSRFASEDEIIQVCKVVASHDGIVMIYLKDDRNLFMESIDMVARIGRKSGARMHISQMKAVGMNYRGKIGAAIDKIERYRQEGISLTYDVYPYAAMYSPLKVLMGRTSAGIDEIYDSDRLFFECIKVINSNIEAYGGDENIMITTCHDSALIGKRLKEIKARMGLPAAEVVLKLLKNYGDNIRGLFFSIGNSDLEELIKYPLTNFCTGGLVSDFPHPRLYGTFPRVLGSYARKLKIITMEEAIRKMTSEPAKRLRLMDRGILREGMAADMVLFDPSTVRDLNSYLNPKIYPAGIRAVLVDGEVKWGNL